MKYAKLEVDGPYQIYEILKKYIPTLKNVPGLSCEIGLRRGGGTRFIMESFLENNDIRTHICLDPYGNILYNDIAGEHRSDYTNDMRNETLCELYKFAYEKRLNILFFNLEDSEFYYRFGDGVPIYNEEKELINTYCFVHVDGQHDTKSVMLAAKFFITRMSVNGIIAFDNTDHYDHTGIHKLLINNGYEFLEDVLHKKIYKRVS